MKKIAYKGFNKDMKCRGMQYEEGKTYKAEGEIKLCVNGFHACENPLDVLHYYPIAKGSKYHIVECDGDISNEEAGDSKFACREITVGAEITIGQLIKAGITAVFEKARRIKGNNYAQGNFSIATTNGDSSLAATQGNFSLAATNGYCSTAATQGSCSTAATQGSCSTATTNGNFSLAATQGDFSIATTNGDSSLAATQGDFSIATTNGDSSLAATNGYCSTAATQGSCSTAATNGYYSSAATQGSCSTAATQGNYSTAIANGNDSIALANGYAAKAKAALGCYIVLTEYRDGELVDCQCRKVDGKEIKPDTFYKLVGGEFVEAEE